MVSTCRSLEQYYIDLYKPVYNILPKVGDSSGFKLSEETKSHLSSIHSGELHPQYGVAWSTARRLANSIALKSHFDSNVHHNLGKKGVNAPQYGINGKSVYCYSSDGQFMHFLSINQARIWLKVRNNTVRFNIDNSPIIIRGVT